ncbi:aspartate aminotransferase family protein [Microaerobacter geothermalis]|uniref:aspartate aminotransferase family protein n=1 Tax=Microaerobacter geothermalis TaxID=674972 RepID=UPI001F1E8113|nr:aspartate aminotransferase family protein [Microaerobacter geothermalis]MCF6092380.1 aspartate aminotransferase family protein [Microaerobacter geothermalis]
MAIEVLEIDPKEALIRKTPGSKRFFEEAQQVMPGGVTANIKYFDPYPIIMGEANGSRLRDIDGNPYIDYLLCYGALMLGHGHFRITNAVLKQMMNKGTTIFGTPHELEVEMAKKLIHLYRGIEQVRYTNSGTEATLLAVRLACAYTGKDKIAKFEGHYHGGYEQVLVSVNPPLDLAGEEEEPQSIPESAGVTDYHLQHTISLPFNQLEATEKILRKNADELAAVIIEPVQGGFIPAKKEFLAGLRKITDELNIVLIFDEVKTGFRVALGGAQEHYQIKPDLTTLGKVLGGGFPIGVVGGKKEIMEISSPQGKRDALDISSANVKPSKSDVLFHSGTYNGHPSILAAGLATIEVLEETDSYQQIILATERLKNGINDVFNAYRVPGKTIGLGSIFNVVITDHPVQNYRDMVKSQIGLRKELDYELLNLGIYTKPLNRYSVSLSHTEKEIQYTIDAYDMALKRMKRRGIF